MKNAVLIIGILITSSLSFAGQSENTKSKIATMQSSAKGEVKTVATPTVAVVNNNPNAADFKFENESHDFGVIPEGPQAKFDFEFTNTGQEALILTDVFGLKNQFYLAQKVKSRRYIILKEEVVILQSQSP